MTTQEAAIAKLRQLPEPLAQLVLDFINLLLTIPTTQPNPTVNPSSIPTSQDRRLPGSARGLIRISPDFNAPLDDF
jgi:hypothetical protein